MADHPNVRLAEEAWNAVSRSDVKALRSLWSEDLVWHVQGDSPWTGDHIGAEAIIDYLAQVGEASENYSIELDDILANDNYVVVLSQVKTKIGDHQLDTPYVLIGRIEDSRIVEVWTLPMEPDVANAFWKSVRV